MKENKKREHILHPVCTLIEILCKTIYVYLYTIITILVHIGHSWKSIFFMNKNVSIWRSRLKTNFIVYNI